MQRSLSSIRVPDDDTWITAKHEDAVDDGLSLSVADRSLSSRHSGQLVFSADWDAAPVLDPVREGSEVTLITCRTEGVARKWAGESHLNIRYSQEIM